ncbi:MAG: hypothetical protein ACXVCP_04615 [Bdellovibrio sp.]
MYNKCFIALIIVIVSQFETSWGDENRFKILAAKDLSLPQDTRIRISTLNQADFQKKIMDGLKKDFNSREFLSTLGPGVTGGGDSCEQKIAYSFFYLASLISRNKIDLLPYGVSTEQLMIKITDTKLRFGQDLEVNRPVEAINIPSANMIILDRKICLNSFEPLYYYTPLLLHEVLRLVKIEDGADYHISSRFISTIQNDIGKATNTGRKYRILDKISDDIALAWGLADSDIDFEELDTAQKGWDFYSKNRSKLENYLVDLKTQKIIGIVRSAGSERPAIIEISGEPINSSTHDVLRFDYGLGSTRIGIVSFNDRKSSGIEMIFATQTNDFGQKQIIGICQKTCEQKIILPALLAQMTEEQRKKLSKFSIVDSKYEMTNTEDGRTLWQVNVRAYNDDDHDETMMVEGVMQMTFEDGNFKTSVVKIKAIEN